jgi:hypothetical protein
MMHNDRTWCLTPAESAEDLARKLTEMTRIVRRTRGLHGRCRVFHGWAGGRNCLCR